MDTANGLPPIFLCRHGETDWNAEGRIQGQMDIPLNALGRDQAARNGRELRARLGARPADLAFLASPLSRAVETMRIIREALDLPPDDFPRDERLRELHFGDWQGQTLAEVEAADPQIIVEREADKWGFCPPGPGAERYEDLARRIRPVFEGLTGRTLVVAHGGVTRTFMRVYLGLAPAEAAHLTIDQDRVLAVLPDGHAWV